MCNILVLVQILALVCSFGDSGGFAGVAPQAMRSIIDQSTTGWLSGSEGFGDWGPVIPLNYFTVLGFWGLDASGVFSKSRISPQFLKTAFSTEFPTVLAIWGQVTKFNPYLG